MKKYLLFVCMICVSCFSAFSQEQLSFEKVIKVDSVKKDVIFSSLIQWIGSNYHNVKNDSQLSDKEAGYIIKQASIPFVKTGFMQCYGGFIDYKMKFQIKDGRFKIELTDFTHRINRNDCAFNSCMGIITTDVENPLGGGMNKSSNNKIWNEIKKLCESKANELFSSLEKLNYKSFDNSKNNNW